MCMVRRFKVFDRSELEMHHLSFVRKDLRRKLLNVSNRKNYNSTEQFLKKISSWNPAKGLKEGDIDTTIENIHPHPYYKSHFKALRIVPNQFKIPLMFPAPNSPSPKNNRNNSSNNNNNNNNNNSSSNSSESSTK